MHSSLPSWVTSFYKENQTALVSMDVMDKVVKVSKFKEARHTSACDVPMDAQDDGLGGYVEPSWLVCSRPNSDDDEAAATEAYVHTYVADQVELGHGGQGSARTQLPLVPGRVYMIGEPHKKKAYHTLECGMVQKWMRDLPSNVHEITKEYAVEKKLKACKQCRP